MFLIKFTKENYVDGRKIETVYIGRNNAVCFTIGDDDFNVDALHAEEFLNHLQSININLSDVRDLLKNGS